MVQMHGNHYVAGLEPRLVPLSKALYHTCFICGQRCKRWSRRPKLTSSVISDVKPIIYIYILLEYQPFSCLHQIHSVICDCFTLITVYNRDVVAELELNV